MNELLLQIISELKGSWRFRWLALIAAWVICVGGWLAVFGLPDSYESKASVYINTNSPLWESLRGLANSNDILERVAVEAKSLQSRPQLAEIARETDLHLTAAGPEAMEALVDSMARNMSIQNNRRIEPNLYRFSYRHANPETAKLIVAKLMSKFVEETMVANRQDTENTQEFYRKQLRITETELAESEQELAEFKKRNVGQMPGAEGDYFARLQTSLNALEETQAAIRLAARRREALRQQLSGEKPTMDTDFAAQSEIDQRISQNRNRLEELQLRFTELHPDVISIKATIEELEAQKAKEMEELAKSGEFGVASDNPVFQNIQIELTNVNVEIATLEETKKGHEQRIASLQTLVDVLPQVEVELAKLTRDYDVKQTQYQALLTRLGQAELSESAENSQDARFRVIEPATLPDAPIAPNRPLLLTMVLLLGLGCGGGIAFIANKVNPVISSVGALRELSDFPVLGSVQVMRTAERKAWRARQIRTFSLGIVGLCLAFGTVFIFQDLGRQFLESLV